MAADAFKNDPDQYDPDLSDPQLTGADPYDSGQLDPAHADPAQFDPQYDPAQYDPDMPDPSAGLPRDLDTAAPFHGNRPATGAHHGSPGDILSQGFDGDQSAGDFLGLDVEFTASQGPMDPNGLDLVSPPGTADSHSVPVPAPLPAGDAAQEFAEAPSAFEFGEDLGSEDAEAGEFAFQDEGGPGHGRGLMAGALVAILVGAGVFFGPRFLGPKADPAPSVAKAPTPAVRSTPPPAAGTESTPVDPVAPAAGSGATSGASKGADPVVEPPQVASKEPTAATSGEKDPADTTFTRVTTPSSGGADPVLDPASSGSPSTRSRTEVVQSSAVTFPDLSGSAYEWASEDRLELIWRGEEVPLDAVRAPAKTIMPRVGRVRVLMDTGDVFDGRLYAVGQNRVWIESEPGRIGLDGERVVKIELMPESVDGTDVPAEELGVGGKRVRVRVAGGTLFGRVIKAEGNEVIMKLDSGGRVRVEADEVHELGSGRAVVVRR